ncbi:MAG: ankyrin repeat domain-containing protein [Myxococcota bacterium]
MARWLDRLLGRGTNPTAGSEPRPAKWLAADDPGNPFGVPLLDLMELQELTSTTTELAYAQRSVSWGESVGSELSPAPLLSLPPIECALRYPAARSLPDGILYAPPSQDFKWVLALREGRLLAARSWTGVVEAVADARRDGDFLVLERLRIADESGLRLGSRFVEVFDWLIRVHVWDQRLPLPVDDAFGEQLRRVPVSGFGPFGKALFCAAKTWSPPPPPRPLRADGDVILATHRADLSALARALDDGADVDAPSTFQGRTALQLAAMKADDALVVALLERGAKPTASDDRGMQALGIAVVAKAPLSLMDHLLERGADVGQPNDDGFTALHAAAEVDNAEAIPWLVSHGAPLEARTRHGHTALHIACGLGHPAAARALLEAGAERLAASPTGTPEDVARAERKPELVRLLSTWK